MKESGSMKRTGLQEERVAGNSRGIHALAGDKAPKSDGFPIVFFFPAFLVGYERGYHGFHG